MNPSSILSVAVLALTVIVVVGIGYAGQNMRHLYLQRLMENIELSQEAVSVSGVFSTSSGVIAVRSLSSRGVVIEEARVTVGFRAYYTDGTVVADTMTKRFGRMFLGAYETRYLLIDLIQDAGLLPRGLDNITINYAAVSIVTEKGTYVFDTIPKGDMIILTIHRYDVGRSFRITLPNGKTAIITVLEVAFCHIGPRDRMPQAPPLIDSVKVYATSPDGVVSSQYDFGYDVARDQVPPVQVDITTSGNVTTCTARLLDRGYSFRNLYFTLDRAVLIVGTQMTGYDFTTVEFREDVKPQLVSSAPALALQDSRFYVSKIPLPNPEAQPFLYLATQVVGRGLAGDVFVIGHSYSQAVLVGQSFSGAILSNAREAEMSVEFYEPYPVILVISAPTVG